MSSSQPFFDGFGNDDDVEFNYMLQEYDEQLNDSLAQPAASQKPQRKGTPVQTVVQRRSNDNGNDNSSNGGSSGGDTSCVQAPKHHNSPKNLKVKDVMSGPADKKFARVFEFEEFNLLQSRCFDVLYNSDVNIVVSGKQASKQAHSLFIYLFSHLSIFSAHSKREDDCV